MYECALCGADQPDVSKPGYRWFLNRRGEAFCSRYHRQKSNMMLRAFLEAEGVRNEP